MIQQNLDPDYFDYNGMIAITEEEMDRMANELAELKLVSILPENMAYFHYMNDEKAKAAFKKTYLAFLKERYITIPAIPKSAAAV